MIQGLAFRLKDLVCKETGVPCWWRSERLKIEYLSQQSKKTFKKFNNQLLDLHEYELRRCLERGLWSSKLQLVIYACPVMSIYKQYD